MSKLHLGGGPPTMIIPSGTQIEVDVHGQLSVRTPGNLVIQNSGIYHTLESVAGSIRIEPDVKVEAVHLRCADTCYVQGQLVCWRVTAKVLHLDGAAQAQVMMQETEKLEIGRNARLVGNFRSEREIFGLFSRFARQARSLSLPLRGEGAEAPAPGVLTAEAVADEEVVDGEAVVEGTTAQPAGEIDVAEGEELAPEEDGSGGEARAAANGGPDALPEDLFFALLLLERESQRGVHGPSSRRILGELAKLLREGDLETLRHTYRTLFARVREPGEDLRRARRLVTGFFAS